MIGVQEIMARNPQIRAPFLPFFTTILSVAEAKSPRETEATMRYLEQTLFGALAMMLSNMDRFLPPLLITAALMLAGMVLSYATVP